MLLRPRAWYVCTVLETRPRVGTSSIFSLKLESLLEITELVNNFISATYLLVLNISEVAS